MTKFKGKGNTEVTVTNNMNISDISAVFHASGLFTNTNDKYQACVKIMAGQELGFLPIQSMMGIHVIKGRVTLSANLIGAKIKSSGKYRYVVEEHTAQKCKLMFKEKLDGAWIDLGVSEFTIEDAKRAKLSMAPDSNWSKYPKNMLFWRALSNGAKFYCADIFGGGVYTPDEIGADVSEDGELKEAEVTVSPETPQEAKENEEVIAELWDAPKAEEPPPAPRKKVVRRKAKAKRSAPKEVEILPPPSDETNDVLAGAPPEEEEDTMPEGPQDMPQIQAPEGTKSEAKDKNGLLLFSENGIAHLEWEEMTEDQRKAGGHCTESQIRLMASVMRTRKLSGEGLKARIQKSMPHITRAWQMSKLSMGAILDELLEEGK